MYFCGVYYDIKPIFAFNIRINCSNIHHIKQIERTFLINIHKSVDLSYVL